ncbi:MAG: lytic transglycosylase domain-containing protein [Alphaproteobacteria bacterium]|nr:lytic transglycosylase domain-containing protein [Alphaproteobacteria bacterium]
MLVLITLITTPTQAYEAYNINSLLIIEEDETTVKKSTLALENDSTPSTTTMRVTSALEPKTHDLCLIAINDVENSHNIKQNLLHTIASVESGKYITSVGKRLPWPWTVHANGKGRYYKTKEDAIKAVQTMQQQGIKNIDVGCMQINLRYHGKSFKNLDEAFDPKKNVTYSATFLNKLHKRTNDWKKTAMQYHSKNIHRGTNYKNRLEKHYAEYVRTDISSALF